MENSISTATTSDQLAAATVWLLLWKCCGLASWLSFQGLGELLWVFWALLNDSLKSFQQVLLKILLSNTCFCSLGSILFYKVRARLTCFTYRGTKAKIFTFKSHPPRKQGWALATPLKVAGSCVPQLIRGCPCQTEESSTDIPELVLT